MNTTTARNLPVPPIDLEALPAADALPIQPQATPGFRVARVLLSGVVRSLFHIRAEGLQSIPEGPYVLIANHLNWVDVFAVVLSFPSEPRLHVLGEVKHIINHRLQWKFARTVGGVIPVANGRKDPRLFGHVDHCLKAGGVVLIFPEGRYGAAEGGLGEFKKGFAHFAVNNGVPVVPIGITGSKHLWWRKRIRLTIGEPIETRGRDVNSVAELGRSAVQALIPVYREPRGPKLFRQKLTHLFYSGSGR